MRQLVRDTIDGVKAQMRDLHEQTRAQPLSDDELLARYEQFHRNQPAQLITFARRNAPAGTDPIAQAMRYEAQMEALRKRRNLNGNV
jgi:hypothetical protein